MGALALSRLLGLARTMVFGHFFGTGAEMDAYGVAARIPEMLFLIMAGGALGSAFIPLFTERLAQGAEEEAWRLASSIINLLIALLAPVSLLAIILAPWLVRTWVAPEFSPQMQALTVDLLRVMLLTPMIFGISGILMGVLNGYQHFLMPALAPSVYNLALIGGAVWGGLVGGGTRAVAAASVIGAVAHLLTQLLGLWKYPARYRLTFGWDDPAVREVAGLMLPRMLGVAAIQVNFVITNNLASGLEVGAVSVLLYAWNLVLLPQGIFAQALGITCFPTLSTQAARGDLEGLRETIAVNLRVLLALLLPAMVGLIVLGEPLVALLLQRGEFDSASTQAVAYAMALFSIGLLGHGALEILARAFYAVHNTWIPTMAALIAVVLNVALGLGLPPVFARAGFPAFGGLALANSLAILVETVVLVVLIRQRVGDLDLGALARWSIRPAVAALGMGVVVVLWRRVAPGMLLETGGGTLLGLGSYLSLAWLLGVEELRRTVTTLLHRRRLKEEQVC